MQELRRPQIGESSALEIQPSADKIKLILIPSLAYVTHLPLVPYQSSPFGPNLPSAQSALNSSASTAQSPIVLNVSHAALFQLWPAVNVSAIQVTLAFLHQSAPQLKACGTMWPPPSPPAKFYAHLFLDVLLIHVLTQLTALCV